LEQTVAVVRSLGQTSRILLAPDQRLPNDFVLVGAKEMPQEAFGGLLVNERGKLVPAGLRQACNSIT
jgi:hypothetical protein